MSSGDQEWAGLPMTDRKVALFSPAIETVSSELEQAIESSRDWLLERQSSDGYWVGELEGDTILESEYVLLLTWLGNADSDLVQRCAKYIARQQLPTGGWSLYPGGPLEISSSVKAYWVLKIAGYNIQSEPMLRAKMAILAAGGAERVNSFTRYYMALLGGITYKQCPAVPPELMLLPKWSPINIYEMSSWSRTIVVPLSLLWAFQPKTKLPKNQQIDELFSHSPAEMPVSMPPSEQLDELKSKSWIPWSGLFRTVDRIWKRVERLHLNPFRKIAVAKAHQWIVDRFEKSDGLGAIFPPIIWSVIGLRCLGYEEDSPEVQTALNELKKLTIHEGDTARLEPCRSPVWDTSIALNALREADVPAKHPQLQKAVDWLLSKEVRNPGDWSERHPDIDPAGWYFEFNNEFYPDIDDTIMVTMGLARCLPGSGEQWSDQFIKEQPAVALDESSPQYVMAGKANSAWDAIQDIQKSESSVAAISRALKWVGAMQCRNGGWAAFDADNDREILTRVPFADHNAMIDPPTADITARTLEMYGRLGMKSSEEMFTKALDFVWSEQEEDGAWYGRWGVNYLYGTWQVIVGLTEFGIPAQDVRLQKGVEWLKKTQQADGGWGETPRTYDEPHLRGTGPTTPSQTAWALMGLMAGGVVDSEEVRKGIHYLLDTQTAAGSWDEKWYTGTGFPKVFYLKYHLYRHYFPLMALARYRKLKEWT
jgi:squalene-hopene/tetraprenyl-beta-curcumene cyclase